MSWCREFCTNGQNYSSNEISIRRKVESKFACQANVQFVFINNMAAVFVPLPVSGEADFSS